MYKVKKTNEGSWISHFIVPQHGKGLSAGTEAKSCELESNSYQRIFSKRVTQKNSDPRCLLLVSQSELFDDLDPVYFDPELDPPPKACFNCWRGVDYEKKHNHYSCSKPQRHQFCENCGRRDADVSACPRCARGYREFVKRGCKSKRGFVWRPMRYSAPRPEKKVQDSFRLVVEEVNGYSGTCASSSKIYDKAGFNVKDDDFTFENRSEYTRRNRKKEPPEKMENHSRSAGKLDKNVDANFNVEGEDDENYDDIIVDENERSEEASSFSSIVLDFLRMLENSRWLPIPDQNSAILQFIEKRREQIERNNNRN